MEDDCIDIQDKIHTLGHIGKSGMSCLHEYKHTHTKNMAFNADLIEKKISNKICGAYCVLNSFSRK
jgi:hypothetical protein